MRACAFPRTPGLPLASACLSYLSLLARTPGRPTAVAPDFQRGPWWRSSLSVDTVPEELLRRVVVAAIVLDATAGRPLRLELLFLAPGMKAAQTFALWSTTPLTPYSRTGARRAYPVTRRLGASDFELE